VAKIKTKELALVVFLAINPLVVVQAAHYSAIKQVQTNKVVQPLLVAVFSEEPMQELMQAVLLEEMLAFSVEISLQVVLQEAPQAAKLLEEACLVVEINPQAQVNKLDLLVLVPEVYLVGLVRLELRLEQANLLKLAQALVSLVMPKNPLLLVLELELEVCLVIKEPLKELANKLKVKAKAKANNKLLLSKVAKLLVALFSEAQLEVQDNKLKLKAKVKVNNKPLHQEA